MVDRNTFKNNLNDRLKEIDNMVDNIIPNDYINTLITKYKSELRDFDYIDRIELFSTLRLRGTMKYINKYDKKLRSGGFLIKIFQKNSKWIAIIMQGQKKYYVSFDANYIFYINSKADLIRNWADFFVSECDKGNYEY